MCGSLRTILPIIWSGKIYKNIKTDVNLYMNFLYIHHQSSHFPIRGKLAFVTYAVPMGFIASLSSSRMLDISIWLLNGAHMKGIVGQLSGSLLCEVDFHLTNSNML